MILRELPDVWSSDLVVVATGRKGSVIKSVTIHRIQVQLGRSTLTKAGSEDIVAKLDRGDKIVKHVVGSPGRDGGQGGHPPCVVHDTTA